MLLLKNGKIITMDKKQIVYGDILIKDGIIEDIDTNIICEGAKKIDLKNSIVMPGLIDGHSSIGLIESGVGFAGNDLNETSISICPELSPKDGINIKDISFKEAIAAGITSALVCPGSSGVVPGKCSMFKSYGKNPTEMCYKEDTALKINLGDRAKSIHRSNVEMPRSRMGIAYMIRKLFSEEIQKEYPSKTIKDVLEKKMPVIFLADKAQDVITAIEIKDEFDLDIILLSCTEGYNLIEEIAERNIPVFQGPFLTDYSNRELMKRRYDSPKIMNLSNISTSIVTSHPEVPTDLLTLNAAIAVKEGLDYLEGLKSITINPAKTLGVDHRVGSITKGKDGDLVVFDGDPLKLQTKTIMTIVNGEIAYER